MFHHYFSTFLFENTQKRDQEMKNSFQVYSSPISTSPSQLLVEHVFSRLDGEKKRIEKKKRMHSIFLNSFTEILRY